jgi:inhibitor of KinA
MAPPREPAYTPIADHSLLVSFADAISDEANAAVIALDRALAQSPPAGLRECVPAFVSLLVDFDPLITDHARIKSDVERLHSAAASAPLGGRLREIDVCYETLSPDLPAVAKASGLSIDAVINCHLQGDYRVRMYGFAPGYAYMSGVPAQIQLPRKATPIRDVPDGAVLIAGPQCLVTTLTMPTGWSIIGRSPTRILARDQETPFLLDVGDTVRFRRIDLAQYGARAGSSRP